MLQAFICYCSSSDVYDVRVCAGACVIHWHCTAQMSMFNMEKRYRNKIIIITITILNPRNRPGFVKGAKFSSWRYSEKRADSNQAGTYKAKRRGIKLTRETALA